MTAKIFHLPVRDRPRTAKQDQELEAATEWLLTELNEFASVEALRALAEKELKRPRSSTHKRWARCFLNETVQYVKEKHTMKIYVASSWRNEYQQTVVETLRQLGHEVYDFRNPAPGKTGFGWRQCDPSWVGEPVDGRTLREVWKHPVAEAGFQLDITALNTCDAVVYVLPCGRSASWEFGYAMGQEKKGYVFQLTPQEPELMFMRAKMLISWEELREEFRIKQS